MEDPDTGVWGVTSDFYLTQNGRITNALISGIVYSQGMLGPQVLPTVLIIALGLGLYLLGREVLGAWGMRAPGAVLVPAVLVVEALLFLGGTRSYQMLWAPAAISHTLPTVLGIGALLAAVGAGRAPGRVVASVSRAPNGRIARFGPFRSAAGTAVRGCAGCRPSGSDAHTDPSLHLRREATEWEQPPGPIAPAPPGRIARERDPVCRTAPQPLTGSP
ncbi:hypothetical protein [Streptomyces sp. 3211]|uniref:hypothetical protein n=1 Tax=Streptomyces sp. 3211 TaxID=1964449 RepID=UPI0013316E59|nr:hypothetical protein [Streptomyces sp. 3211]